MTAEAAPILARSLRSLNRGTGGRGSLSGGEKCQIYVARARIGQKAEPAA